jgi:hypothetical protein
MTTDKIKSITKETLIAHNLKWCHEDCEKSTGVGGCCSCEHDGITMSKTIRSCGCGFIEIESEERGIMERVCFSCWEHRPRGKSSKT